MVQQQLKCWPLCLFQTVCHTLSNTVPPMRGCISSNLTDQTVQTSPEHTACCLGYAFRVRPSITLGTACHGVMSSHGPLGRFPRPARDCGEAKATPSRAAGVYPTSCRSNPWGSDFPSTRRPLRRHQRGLVERYSSHCSRGRRRLKGCSCLPSINPTGQFLQALSNCPRGP